MTDWSKSHIVRVGKDTIYPGNPDNDIEQLRQQIEPWLTAVFQSEHLSLLLGSGFTASIAHEAGAEAAGMGKAEFGGLPEEEKLNEYAVQRAKEMGRGAANIEDQISATQSLIVGLKVSGADAKKWEDALDKVLTNFHGLILATEKVLKDKIEEVLVSGGDDNFRPHQLLTSFLLSFASRAASRERLHLFTTNYERLIEQGCDLAGIRLIDRFVGYLSPVFRASRIGVDLHYNPPGMRGEPRYLEGVVNFSKLHGSIDWSYENRVLRRIPIGFGANPGHVDLPKHPSQSVMIYPNSAKDVETAVFPYAELFRDFATALCRPNSAVVLYGYGFGDDHINRVLEDMLTIPSTHLVIISFDDASGRVKAFCDRVRREHQISLLIGPHYGSIRNLTDHYLPKPAIDPITFRMGDLLDRRKKAKTEEAPAPEGVAGVEL